MKHNKSKLEPRYKRFDRLVKIFLYSLPILALLCRFIFAFASYNKIAKLFGYIIIVIMALIIICCFLIVKQRRKYLVQFCEERESIVREGIFKEIFDAYKHDGFEFNLKFDKLLNEEYYNNSIDISLKKNNHEFDILIDEDGIYIIADEETDSPTETEAPLDTFKTMEQVYAFLNDFIYLHS